MNRAIVLAVLVSTFVSPLTLIAASAPVVATPTGTELKIFSPSGDLVSSFRPFDKAGDEAGGVAVADLGNDGTSEIVVSAGPGNKPLVRVMRLDGSLINEFSAYASGMKSGVNVAVCDINGDGQQDIVTGAMYGGGAHVRVFSADGKFVGPQFFAYDEKLRNGVNVACADVDADGQTEIVTGSGPGGGAELKVFSASGVLEHTETISEVTEKSGVYVFTGNLDQDTEHEVMAAPMGNGTFDLTIFDLTPTGFVKSTKTLGQTSPSYGLSVAADMKAIVSANGAYSPKQQITNPLTQAAFVPFPDAPEIAPRLSIIPETGNIVALGTRNNVPIDPADQFIKVDISEQKLYTYVNNVEVKSFLVSTAKPGYKTPIGKTTIMAKIPVMTYAWNYGAGDPRNYSLPNVKWNMRVFPHIYIHTAYWHNSFGKPVSHGCINMRVSEADWVYHFANVGTAVETMP